MGHQVRATQQEQQKRKYIDALDESTDFLTVDWSQKKKMPLPFGYLAVWGCCPRTVSIAPMPFLHLLLNAALDRRPA